MKTIKGYDVRIYTDNIDKTAVEQLRRLLSVDVFADKKIRIMPDVHAGAGCVIGFTGNLGDKVIPNIVGVDIGCGMRVAKLGRLSDIDFHAFHEHICRNVLSGMMAREEKFGFGQLPEEYSEIADEAKRLVESLHCLKTLKSLQYVHDSLGTLGGGNHFIELDRDDDGDGDLYLVIHTGSRNLGKQVADFYQKEAVRYHTAVQENFEETVQKVIDEYKAAGRAKELQAVIKQMWDGYKAPDVESDLPADLCYLEGELRERYLHDMRLCQRWAVLNRELIARLLLRFFSIADAVSVPMFESVHNYISDDNLIRKGSISAASGERCIIPLNMRDGSLLCTGKGNDDWNCSAPHGAGRVLSRSQANKNITMEDFRRSMKGIYSESVSEFTLDESPMAYKPSDEIIANIGETVDIDTIIRPVFNFKATK